MCILTEDYLKSKGFKKERNSFCLPIEDITFKVIKNGELFLPSLILRNGNAIPFRYIRDIKDLEDLIEAIKKIFPFIAY